MSLNFDASLVLDKGLSNYVGHNNCFLNSAIQVLWHLDVFRKNFLALKHHYCVKGPCIYCSLQDIFKEFSESAEEVLHPDLLRITLATTFQDCLKFQLGELDDASECYENILSRIHFHLSQHLIQEDCCSLEYCLTHKKFSMSLIQQSRCLCGSTSEPLPFNQLVHFVSTSSVVKTYKDNESQNFGEVLKSAFNSGLVPGPCSPSCEFSSYVTHTLVNLPDVISIGLIWESDQSDPIHIKEFVSTIGTSIKLGDLFDKVIESNGNNTLELVGVVCYYLKHYSTFFFHSKKKIWISFDDASVNEIGKDWSKVIDKCYKGKYQPLLLIYQNSNASLIDIKMAPCKTVYINDVAVSIDQTCETATYINNHAKISTMDKLSYPIFYSNLYSNAEKLEQKIKMDSHIFSKSSKFNSQDVCDFTQENYLINSAVCGEEKEFETFKPHMNSNDSNLSSWTLLDICDEQNNNPTTNRASPIDNDELFHFEWPSGSYAGALHEPTKNSSHFRVDDLEAATQKKILRDKVKAIYR